MYHLVIPEYVTNVKLAEARLRKTFREDSATELPEKYQNARYVWKKGKLWDLVEEEFVSKNPKAMGTPRWMMISGNEIMRMHERIRMKIIAAIKDNFRPYLVQLPKPLPTPVMISMELFCPPLYSNWDLDNLWIYTKCLQDLLQDEEYLPNDSVARVTGSGGIVYTPVVSAEERKMIFTFKKDHRSIIEEHNMFNTRVLKPTILSLESAEYLVKTGAKTRYEIIESRSGKAGEMKIQDIRVTGNPHKVFSISIGKRRTLYAAVHKALGHVYSHCVQLNVNPIVSATFYHKYERAIKKEIVDKFIQVYIYDDKRGSLFNSAQNDSNKV